MTEEKIGNTEFDQVMTLAYAFEENSKQDGPNVSWEEIKPKIWKLSLTELEVLLGLVRNKK
ncbi:hypothetical protein ACFLYF_04600 [Chloroflexota bacterium]